MIVCGIDIGSITVESVIMHNDNILGWDITPTGAVSRISGQKSFASCLKRAKLKKNDIEFIVATGYGRNSLDFTHKVMTEITCHGKGAQYLFPQTRTVIDVGGQDSKAIRIDGEGNITDFALNDKCAAGTGRFLEVMAPALETDLNNLGKLSLKAKSNVKITSMCTVFAESEVISLIAEGMPKEEIIRGLHDAIAEKILSLVNRVGIEEMVTVTGGVAKNIGFLQVLKNKLGLPLNIPEEPQIVGALGAALIANEIIS